MLGIVVVVVGVGFVLLFSCLSVLDRFVLELIRNCFEIIICLLLCRLVMILVRLFVECLVCMGMVWKCLFFLVRMIWLLMLVVIKVLFGIIGCVLFLVGLRCIVVNMLGFNVLLGLLIMMCVCCVWVVLFMFGSSVFILLLKLCLGSVFRVMVIGVLVCMVLVMFCGRVVLI